eukprot:6108632-Pyramimonas_sp.AAC.1
MAEHMKSRWRAVPGASPHRWHNGLISALSSCKSLCVASPPAMRASTGAASGVLPARRKPASAALGGSRSGRRPLRCSNPLWRARPSARGNDGPLSRRGWPPSAG